MRRISLLFVFVILIGTLAACGGGSSKKSTSTAATSTTSTTSTSSPTGAASSTASAATSSTPSGRFGYGFNVFVRGDDNGADFNSKTIDAVKGAGFNWVRIQIEWKSFERAKGQWDPLPLDRVVGQFEGAKVDILASVAKPPDWALDPSGKQLLANTADFQDFMRFVADRYKGKIQAWEIWNEENLASEMGGQVRIDDYAQLLKAGYTGAKQGDSNAVVVFGGLTPTGVNDPNVAIDDLSYLKQFYQYQGGAFTRYFDVLGMHVSATNNPPDKMYPDNPGTGNWSNDPSFYFRRAEQLHQVQVDHQDSRPVWITEFGWTTKNQAKGYEYGADVTPQNQADYLVGAFNWAEKNWPWTTAMFVWNLNYSTITSPSDEKYPWSVMNADWSPRPSYTALQNMPKR